MYLLDSDWAIHVLGGHPLAVQTIRQLCGSFIAISWFNVAELYEGAFASPNPRARLVETRHLIGSYRLIHPDNEIAEHFAEIRAHLRRRGEMIPDMDLLIAATAVRHGLTLLTFNLRHMARVPDLKVYSAPAQ